jgi:plasmid stabilization system protein ParE
VEDLAHLHAYIAQDNPEAAATEAVKAVKAVKRLEDYPASLDAPDGSRAPESW